MATACPSQRRVSSTRTRPLSLLSSRRRTFRSTRGTRCVRWAGRATRRDPTDRPFSLLLPQEDVDPDHIRKRLADAGGSKYSVQQKQQPAAAPRDKIAPVGSAYTPTGKIDMGALKAGKPAASSGGSSTPSTFSKPASTPSAASTPRVFGAPAPVKQPVVSAAPASKPALPQAAPDDDETWGDEPPTALKPSAAAASAPTPKPSTPAPAGSFYRAPAPAAAPAKVEAKQDAEKPKDDDRIAKVVRSFSCWPSRLDPKCC